MYYFYILFFVTFPLFSMDHEASDSLISVSVHDDDQPEQPKKQQSSRDLVPRLSLVNLNQPPTPPLQRIGTMDALKQLGQSQKTFLPTKQPSPAKQPPSSQRVMVTPEVAATVAHTMVYRQDPTTQTSIQQRLQEKFKKLEREDPETFNKMNEFILDYNEKCEGEITAAGLKRYKSQKKTRSTLTTQRSSQPTTPNAASSSESPKRQVHQLLERQSSLQKEMEKQEQKAELQEQELETIRQEMKELVARMTCQAAEETAKEAHDAKDAAESDSAVANRLTKIFGAVGSVLTIVGILSGTLGTLYGNNNNSGSSHCPNGTA